MAKDSIKAIFFDLGRVLIDFNHLQIVEKLSARCENHPRQETQTMFASIFRATQSLCSRFDSGHISPEDFHSEICREFRLDLSFQAFVTIWNETFKENPEVISLVKQLANQYTLVLISNTNPLHFEYILKEFPVISLFDASVLSYEAGLCKPDTRIYRTALARAGVEPSQSVYIDDILEYVVAAEKIGIRGIHFTSANVLKKRLAKLLLFNFSGMK